MSRKKKETAQKPASEAAKTPPEPAAGETARTPEKARSIPGLKLPPEIDWDTIEGGGPTAEEPQTPAKLLDAFRYWLAEANRLTIENGVLRRQVMKSIGFIDDRTDEETEAAKEIKAGVVQAMKDLLPQANRAAKRGKPALLRLIVRTIRTKL